MLRLALAAYGAVTCTLSALVGCGIPAAYERAAQLPPCAATAGLFAIAFATVVGWVVGSAFIACALLQQSDRRERR